jgi:hypothetical protein
MQHKNRFDKERRDILKTLASLGVTPTLLRASTLVGGVVMARVAEAQTGPQKSLILFNAGGALDELWRPRAGLALGPMSAPYESVKSEMNFVVGGRMTGGGHGIMFHRYNDGSFVKDSFDVNLGRTIGANRPLKFLNLGVQTRDGQLSRQGSSGIPPIDDPETAFGRLFGGDVGGGRGMPPAGGMPGNTGMAANPRSALVDLHKKAIDSLKTKLGSHEKTKIDDHLTAISELQKKLQAPAAGMPITPPPVPPPSCAAPAMPSGGAGRSFDETAKLQIEMAVLALKCELTASVSLAFGNDSHNFQVPGYGECHGSHHCCGASVVEYTKTVSYMSGLCARTLGRLKQEGVLATTIVTQVTDMGDARSHANDNVPLFVAGAGIKKGQITAANGKTQADLFQAVAQILRATEHPDARVWSANPVAGLAG